MSWFRTGSSALGEVWRDVQWAATFGLDRSDATDNVWLNLEAGASVALVSDGSWRYPRESRYRLYYRRFSEAPVELTEMILGEAELRGHYDTTQTGAEVYTGIRASCTEVVDRILDARKPSFG